MLVVIEGVLAIIDGWIVDLKDHRLVKPSRACRKRSKEHIAKLNSVPLVNWETLYDEKCVLKNITNEELFKTSSTLQLAYATENQKRQLCTSTRT